MLKENGYFVQYDVFCHMIDTYYYHSKENIEMEEKYNRFMKHVRANDPMHRTIVVFIKTDVILTEFQLSQACRMVCGKEV